MHIKIISPQGKLFEVSNAKALSLSTTSGEIEILDRHENLVTELSQGLLHVEEISGKFYDLFITNGVLEVKDNNVSILTELAEFKDTQILEEIEKSIGRAEEKISTSNLDATELIQLEKLLKYERFKRDNLR